MDEIRAYKPVEITIFGYCTDGKKQMSDTRLSLRSVSGEKGNASFGTAVEIDGTRLDNNMEVGETMATSTRAISTSDIESGVGDFDAITLKRMLTGRVARVSPSVGSRGQSISGSSSVKEMKTMLELAYLYFTQPRRDDDAFAGLINRTRSFLTNRNASPKVDYHDSINPIIYKQLENIAKHGPAASSMQKIKEYLLKQYDQMVITNDYWDYIVWHELEDGVDFGKDYKKMVNEMTSDDVRQMARRILDAKRCIEVTMLSE